MGGGSLCSVRAVGRTGRVPRSCCASPNPREHPQSQPAAWCKTLPPPGSQLPCIPSTCSWSPQLVPIAGVALLQTPSPAGAGRCLILLVPSLGSGCRTTPPPVPFSGLLWNVANLIFVSLHYLNCTVRNRGLLVAGRGRSLCCGFES